VHVAVLMMAGACCCTFYGLVGGDSGQNCCCPASQHYLRPTSSPPPHQPSKTSIACLQHNCVDGTTGLSSTTGVPYGSTPSSNTFGVDRTFGGFFGVWGGWVGGLRWKGRRSNATQLFKPLTHMLVHHGTNRLELQCALHPVLPLLLVRSSGSSSSCV